jgi:hypothetical protein
MDLSQIQVCIFDVNGVLIDSNPANARAMAEAFTQDTALKERIAGLYLTLTGIDRGSKIRIIQEQAIGGAFKGGEFDRRWETFQRLAHRSMCQAPLLPGSKEVLAEVGKRHVTRAALSNTPRVNSRRSWPLMTCCLFWTWCVAVGIGRNPNPWSDFWTSLSSNLTDRFSLVTEKGIWRQPDTPACHSWLWSQALLANLTARRDSTGRTDTLPNGAKRSWA